MSNRAHLGAALCCVLAASLATPAFADGEILLTHAKALAGNVTPGDPPGYPIVLTLPGSYQFAGNIHPAANTIGIQIASQDITIDLNGFRLHGGEQAFYGIAGAAKGVSIRNGTIAGFKLDGIYGEGDFWTIESMLIVENGRGIYFADGPGNFTRILNSTIASNDGFGVRCRSGCLVQGNVIANNQGFGVQIQNGDGGAVLGNVIVNNADEGIAGLGPITGFANNTLNSNNGAGDQVISVAEMHPNLCSPACP